jgi:hypothetical protein
MYLEPVFTPSFCVTSDISAISDETLGAKYFFSDGIAKKIHQSRLLHIFCFPLVARFMVIMK